MWACSNSDNSELVFQVRPWFFTFFIVLLRSNPCQEPIDLGRLVHFRLGKFPTAKFLALFSPKGMNPCFFTGFHWSLAVRKPIFTDPPDFIGFLSQWGNLCWKFLENSYGMRLFWICRCFQGSSSNFCGFFLGFPHFFPQRNPFSFFIYGHVESLSKTSRKVEKFSWTFPAMQTPSQSVVHPFAIVHGLESFYEAEIAQPNFFHVVSLENLWPLKPSFVYTL